jgi:hypothetical protein
MSQRIFSSGCSGAFQLNQFQLYSETILEPPSRRIELALRPHLARPRRFGTLAESTSPLASKLQQTVVRRVGKFLENCELWDPTSVKLNILWINLNAVTWSLPLIPTYIDFLHTNKWLYVCCIFNKSIMKWVRHYKSMNITTFSYEKLWKMRAKIDKSRQIHFT